MTNLMIGYFIEVIMSTLEEKRDAPERWAGRKRIYPSALFLILMVMKALLSKSNNGIWKGLRDGMIKLPPPFNGLSPGRRTIDRRLSGNDKAVEAFIKRVMWRLVLKLASSPRRSS